MRVIVIVVESNVISAHARVPETPNMGGTPNLGERSSCGSQLLGYGTRGQRRPGLHRRRQFAVKK